MNSREPQAGNTIRSAVGFFIFGAVCALLGVFFLLSWRVSHFRTLARTNPAAPAVAPWGVIEAQELPLVNPDGLLPDHAERIQKPRWYFENYSEARLMRLLRSCELSDTQRHILMDKRFWVVGPDGCTITPPEPIIWFLNGHSRAKIYSALASSPSNYSQCFPFRLTEQMFRDSADVSTVAAEKLKRLAYTNGSDVCFSDLQAVEHVLPATDFQELVAQLYREPAYSLRLHVSPGSDVDALVKYWGKGGREKLIAPLLKGLARAPGGGSISISYLLPPFARLRLYTFPDAWNDPTASQQDCFFTALNFFNEKADTNYFDRGYTARFLAAECAETDASPALGDIIALKDSNGDIIHASVYIADGFVFTKNGINHVEPWILMRMADMVAIYFSHGTTGKAVVLRRKA